MTYNEIITTIKSSEIYDEVEFDLFIDKISEAVSDLELSIDQKEELISQLLLNVEKQPGDEFTSWSLIHFIEWLDEGSSSNYSQQILKSVKRKPKYLTLLLMNRIINALPENSNERSVYMAALGDIASNSNLDAYIRKEASQLYEYQVSKGTKR